MFEKSSDSMEKINKYATNLNSRIMESVPRRGFIARLEALRCRELMWAEGTSGASIQGDMICPQQPPALVVSPAGPIFT
jgi:hypothetical protein